MSWVAAVVGLCLFVCASGGCAANWPQREGIVRPDGVYVLHLPGIMGPIPHDKDFAYGLLVAGAQEVRLVDWTFPFIFTNLMDLEWQERQAEALLEELREYREMHPDGRLVITAHSGGGRIALLALDRLQPGDPLVEQLWLLAPSLSPQYDLAPTLDRVGRVVAITSDEDWLILGLGTRLFGNSDRVYGDAAGRVGFLYQHPRFEQWEFDPAWEERTGYDGDHIKVLSSQFVREMIGPSMMNWRASGSEFEYNAFAPVDPELIDEAIAAGGADPRGAAENARSRSGAGGAAGMLDDR
ncbi:MAG: hypothetical protein ACF8PN_04845 [Phycisphaerales bacterium]